MIHTFSVTVETYEHDGVNQGDLGLEIQDEVNSSLTYEASDLYIKSIKIQPITGVIRQHLIGEDTSVD